MTAVGFVDKYGICILGIMGLLAGILLLFLIYLDGRCTVFNILIVVCGGGLLIMGVVGVGLHKQPDKDPITINNEIL